MKFNKEAALAEVVATLQDGIGPDVEMDLQPTDEPDVYVLKVRAADDADLDAVRKWLP